MWFIRWTLRRRSERLREIMTDLVDRAAVVVQRYGGTVGSFTGDGVMAVFGAPITLEDHAVRACLAALRLQGEATRLASDVRERDGHRRRRALQLERLGYRVTLEPVVTCPRHDQSFSSQLGTTSCKRIWWVALMTIRY